MRPFSSVRRLAPIALSLTLVLAPARASAQSGQIAPRAEQRTRSEAPRGGTQGAQARSPSGLRIGFAIPGEWQVRAWALTDQQLATTPGQSEPSRLGQNFFLEQWFRFTPDLSIGEHLRVVSQFDLARGIVVGDTTQQVELSRDARDRYLANGVFDLRWLYLEWTSPIGVIRAGQQGSHWGLGIVANDGNHANVFGDYRMGDIVERIAFATRPLGRNSDLVVAIAGDWVLRDRLTRLLPYEVTPVYSSQPRVMGADWAFQAVLSAFYQDHACRRDCERRRLGAYGVYRDQRSHLPGREQDDLRVFLLDLFARWEWPTPDGLARIFGAIEIAGVFGTTNFAANVNYERQTVQQFGGAAQLGIEREQRFNVTFEVGYASGDRNPVDAYQRRFTFNPDHRVGLILFPEVLAWQTARSASIASDERIVGRPARGADLLPSSGGVTNALYFYPTAVVNVAPWLDLRGGLVVAVASSDLVDPVMVTTRGAALNYRGGDARARDMGVELDFGVMARQALGGGVILSGGVQAGVFFPGHAFDDDRGRSLGTQSVAIARAGLQF